MVHHHHDVEEICQDAFLKAFASLDSFSSDYRFSTWLFTIAYRVSLNHLRRKKPLTGEVDFGTLRARNGDSTMHHAESEDAARLRDLVWSSVDRLSPPQRATLLLFYRHEFGCHEISKILNLPVATVKSHLHRGRGRLQELLEAVPDGQLEAFRNRSGLAG
jgi:RNA polymerase sigma-70 factor (ECF subfamily)